jgi:hypothetical protein
MSLDIIHMSIAKIDFSCPHCKKEYSDKDEKYLSRINRNKNWCTKVFCECKKVFWATCNQRGDIVLFNHFRRPRP